MKTFLKTIATCTLLSAAFAACPNSPVVAQPTQSGQLTAATPSTTQNYDLQFRPRAGERRVLRLRVVQNATQVLPRRKHTLLHDFSMDIEHAVQSVAVEGAAAQGAVLVRATILVTRFKRVTDGKTQFDYDSMRVVKNASGALQNGDEEVAALMVGLPIEMKISSRGSILEIVNTGEIVDQMLVKLQVSTEDQKYLRPMMEQALGQNAFKNLGNLFASFPSTPVAVGQSWPKRDVFVAASGLYANGTLRFAGLTNGFAKLENRAKIEADKKGSANTPAPPDGTQSGVYFVEPQTGWTRQANLTQYLTARLSDSGLVSAKSASGPMIYMKSNFIVSTVSVK